MTKEDYGKLTDEEKENMQIGGAVLSRILETMESCEPTEDGDLIFKTNEGKGFVLMGFIKNEENSPEKPDIE